MEPEHSNTDAWEEVARAALHWRQKFERLFDAIDEYRLWEPGRKGYAAARRKLMSEWERC